MSSDSEHGDKRSTASDIDSSHSAGKLSHLARNRSHSASDQKPIRLVIMKPQRGLKGRARARNVRRISTTTESDSDDERTEYYRKPKRSKKRQDSSDEEIERYV